VDELVQSRKADRSLLSPMSGLVVTDSEPTNSPLMGVPKSASRLALDIGSPITPVPDPSWQYGPDSSSYSVIRIVQCEKPLSEFILRPLPEADQTEIILALPSAKTHSKEYFKALGALSSFVSSLPKHTAILLRPGRLSDLTQVPGALQAVTEQDQVESRKYMLPIALVLLLAFPHLEANKVDDGDSGSDAESDDGGLDDLPVVTKAEIASCLHGLVTLWPDGNPPRAALKRVNEFLMSEKR
jgi:tRNA A64-2'-O-ribosylphosphate transferase